MVRLLCCHLYHHEAKKLTSSPKVSDLQLCALFILSYITNTPVFTLAKFLIDPNIKSYHLFRKARTQRVYRLLNLKEYRNRRVLSILFVKLLLGKKVKPIVDGTILVDSFRLMGDKGYRGCEYIEVYESKEQKGIRQWG